MADGMTCGWQPVAPGWYAVVVDYGRLPFTATRHWDGEVWDAPRGIRAFDGPHDTAAEALDWALERRPEH